MIPSTCKQNGANSIYEVAPRKPGQNGFSKWPAIVEAQELPEPISELDYLIWFDDTHILYQTWNTTTIYRPKMETWEEYLNL